MALDAIALGSMIAQHSGNTLVLKCYITGGTLVWISLLLKRQFKWGKKEWGTLSLVIVCLVVWYFSGSYWATIASTIAVCISAYPQYVESRDADRDPITGYIYAGYGVANTLFFLAGKDWSVEERFYAGMVIPLCVAIAWAALRKRDTRRHPLLEQLQKF